ncbi:alpha/beta hydrolase [Pedobacter aquatilis]|uniref:alpha/beta hydrolase n=1 Tax=Pedobacter aquatilis TaxID=351343 RepID=UPI0025B42E2A|nr:alpha/beta hydrolase [Pedobacter aquatilis]MDN3588645.1 alpha/beta hydrolase [Pedobacter aquatilis]
MQEIEKKSPLKKDKALSKKTKKFLEGYNARPLVKDENLSVTDARQAFSDLQASIQVDCSGIEESELDLELEGNTIKLIILRPENNTDSLPFFVFIHGGGWVLGDYPSHKRMVRDLVVQSGTAGIFVNYSLSPEAKYPQALNEISATLDWLSKNGHKHNLDGTRIALVGNSSGANLAVASTFRAHEQNGLEIRLQILICPLTSHTTNWKSYEKFGDERFLTAAKMKWMFDNYTSDEQALNSIYISPVLADSDQLKKLPPTLIQVAEADILRDQGEKFGRRLDQAGVKVTTVRYNGMIHDFALLNALAKLPQAKSLLRHASAELKKYLNA